MLPSQQGSPGPPHTLHIPLWQVVPVEHACAPVQQGSPGPPQAMQVPPVVAVVEHLVPVAVHTLPQQLCPAEPQPVHCPAAHIPNVVPQALPDARQVPE